MPKVKTNRVKYPEGWELVEPTLNELQAKMREAENDPHDGKRKCEALWPIFKIAHQKSRYIFDLYYRRKEISAELYEFCLDQGDQEQVITMSILHKLKLRITDCGSSGRLSSPIIFLPSRADSCSSMILHLLPIVALQSFVVPDPPSPTDCSVV
ncbi:hypothetical protein E3N88_33064 [Mikania micrantha]|uniref:Uncharacterized protein n=1 Tax=Mikania micrantha TaxID=192012 RepID=A0A5N6MAA9_9ASTR|nr:hypothetical protein E3N88_33064 [Mikania micrantha]